MNITERPALPHASIDTSAGVTTALADLQLIEEKSTIQKQSANAVASEIQKIFTEWPRGLAQIINSYAIDGEKVTAEITEVLKATPLVLTGNNQEAFQKLQLLSKRLDVVDVSDYVLYFAVYLKRDETGNSVRECTQQMIATAIRNLFQCFPKSKLKVSDACFTVIVEGFSISHAYLHWQDLPLEVEIKEKLVVCRDKKVTNGVPQHPSYDRPIQIHNVQTLELPAVQMVLTPRRSEFI
jgi:hypothetical protein